MDVRFMMGWSSIAITAFLIGFNMYLIIKNALTEIVEKIKNKYLKKYFKNDSKKK
jgi:hypothetical protein